MKLLFDQNLSSKLVRALSDLFPDSKHVRELGLEKADDDTVWDYVQTHGFALISKDADFHQRSFLYGFPPKVLWVAMGNCSTTAIEQTIRANSVVITHFGQDGQSAFLVLGGKRG